MLYRFKFHWDNTRQRMLDNGNSRWLLRKTVVRIVTAVLAIIGLSLFACAIEPWEKHFVHTKGLAKGAWQDALPIAPLLFSFIYNLPVTYYTLWYAKPAPPLVDGVIDLIVWAVLTPAVIFAAWGGSFNLWRKPVAEPEGEILCARFMNAFSSECYPALYEIGRLELAGVVFGVFVWLLTTFLFVHGCIEAARRRRHGASAALDRAAFVDLERASRPSHHRRRKRRRRRHHTDHQEPSLYPAPLSVPQQMQQMSRPEFVMPQAPPRSMPTFPRYV